MLAPRRIRALAAVLAVLTAALGSPIDAQSCSVPANTLSFTCGSSCVLNAPCVRKSSSTCAVECFAAASSTFTFLIPYDATIGDTAKASSKSNSVLTKVDKWSLPSTTTTVILRGGSYLVTSDRLRVATVEFADDFLATNTQVTQLRLANLNLAASVQSLVPNFPPRLSELWLANDLLKAFPSEVTDLKFLQKLILTDNLITQVDASHELSTLTALNLDMNAITSFTAVYPKLTYLDLAYNKLSEVPAVISKHTQLQTLHLSGNKIAEFTKAHVVESIETLGLFSNSLTMFDVFFPNLVTLYLNNNNFKEIPAAIFKHTTLQKLYMESNAQLKNVTLTNAQANFIATLKSFKIDASAFSTSCPTSQQVTVQGYAVCIAEGKADMTVIQATRAPSATKASRATASSDDGAPIATTSPQSSRSGQTTTSGTATKDSSSESKTPSEAGTSGDFTLPSTSTIISADNTTSSNSTNSTVLIIVSCVAGVLAIALLVGFVLWKKSTKRRQSGDDASKIVVLGGDKMDSDKSETNYTGETRETRTVGSVSKHRSAVTALWNDPDLLAVKVNSNDVLDIKKIGSGAFCDVWLVMYRNAQHVASKRLRDVTRSRTQDFIDEIKLVATLQHPRIVELVGAAWTKEADLQALFEFMDSGDLRSYLMNEHTTRSWTMEKLQIAIDIAEALVYVHSLNPPLVHRDLKSRNVLLNGEMNAKLTDFGVSRYQSEQNTMTAGVGTGKWLAPEVISGDGNYGPAADIFSFGVVLSELDTHKLPYEDMRGSNGNHLAEVAVLQLVSTGELRPSLLPTCPMKIYELAQSCLAVRPLDRPSAPEVAYILRTFKKSLPV